MDSDNNTTNNQFSGEPSAQSTEPQPPIEQPAAQPAPAPQPIPQPASAQPMPQPAQQPQPAQPTIEPAKDQSKKTNKLAIILGAVVGVLLIATITLLVVTNLPTNTNDNNANDSSSESTEPTDDQPEDSDNTPTENTELSSGSVTTTIGGKSITYSGAYVVDGIEATISSGTYESTTDDQVVFLVINGGSLTISGEVTVNKTGSSDFRGQGDDYSFYGTNSAIVVVGEDSSATINGATITTNVSGANAVVATNSGEVTIKNSNITTSSNNSRGLHATYDGDIEADTVTITTTGGSCASLATDRGAGTVTATNMTLSTAGAGSPLIYSTGDITVTNSTGTATGAQIAVVEGKNSITLDNCDFSANGIGNRNSVDNAGIMIYQSMSGDASVGTGSFTAKNSTFTILSSSSVYTTAPFFFITNTEATINLTDVKANFYPDGYFILASGTDEWGKSGSNGGTVTITATGLEASNQNIGVDEISNVTGL